ncbi:MAG TPA: M23 family metallopeptidase [Chitinophagaceae bacterium]|nr:M23 family metallopeptidase [Chitinophagaceae bacterium]
MRAILIISFFFLAGCAASKNPLRKEFLQIQKGRVQDDTSYVYMLPYESNKHHLVIQGYFSRLSHKERAAIDFKMDRGTKVCAARAGVVVRVKEDGDKGGLKKKFRRYGNNIVIQHDDGTRAGYWHLKKNGALVNVGDTVLQGQVIGLSGNTGYTITPHLHFFVWRFNNRGNWEQVATRFQTDKGIKFLRPLRDYKNLGPR